LFELYQNGDNRDFYVNYYEIWSVFQKIYGMKNADIQELIINVVKTDLKMESVTPNGHKF
jgi:hypothetical protein